MSDRFKSIKTEDKIIYNVEAAMEQADLVDLQGACRHAHFNATIPHGQAKSSNVLAKEAKFRCAHCALITVSNAHIDSLAVAPLSLQ